MYEGWRTGQNCNEEAKEGGKCRVDGRETQVGA